MTTRVNLSWVNSHLLDASICLSPLWQAEQVTVTLEVTVTRLLSVTKQDILLSFSRDSLGHLIVIFKL